jgi:hypothetical protein
MSTLHVNDPRSRARSKSPSGRSRERERSRSRDSRAPSPSPEISKKVLKKYYDSDSADEQRRVKRSSYRETSSKYDLSDSEEEKYRARERERTKDHYYHSDSDDEVRLSKKSQSQSQSRYRDESEKDKKYSRPSGGRRHSPDSSDSEGSLVDSDLEHLAYGDSAARYRPSPSPEARSSRDKYASKGHSRSSSATYHLHDSDPDAPGNHPSYARPGRFPYAQPTQYSPAQAAQFRETRHGTYNGAQPHMPAEWAEAVHPNYIPPGSQPPTIQSIPGAFPPQALPGAFPPPPVSGPPDAYPQAYTGGHTSYAAPPQWHYAQPDPNIKYASKSTKPYTQTSSNQFVKPYTQSNDPQFIEIAPGQTARHRRPHSLSVSSANNLSVSGGLGPGRPPASPLLEAYKGTYQSISPMPSPMAAPMMLSSSRLDDDVSDLEGLSGGSNSDRHRKKHQHESSKSRDETKKERKEKEKEKSSNRDRKSSSKYDFEREVIERVPRNGGGGGGGIEEKERKKVSFYNPTHDAIALKDALSHHLNVDTRPLISILPHLTSDEILALRAEYKNHAKLHGKGINIAKHIKLKLGGTPLGKAAYATALGRWESEAYWANYYYQAGTSRRELLIESLIGRSNAEIREIKNCFRDTRYGDSLEKCMKAELKADKFRTAVLLSLEERRQPERDTVDVHLVQQDVADLHRALVSRDGGETALIYIIVLRSDAHLREVLRVYEGIYKQNFARAMIGKSRNLVVRFTLPPCIPPLKYHPQLMFVKLFQGETLAHILNGAINRPMRDALLLHQAIRETRSGRERVELLISRLVRLHWEPRHLEMVKQEYRRRYDERVEEAIAQEVMASSGGSEWGEFCIELARSSTSLSLSAGRGPPR